MLRLISDTKAHNSDTDITTKRIFLSVSVSISSKKISLFLTFFRREKERKLKIFARKISNKNFIPKNYKDIGEVVNQKIKRVIVVGLCRGW